MNLPCGLPLSRPLTENNHAALLKRSSTVSQQQMFFFTSVYFNLNDHQSNDSLLPKEETASYFMQVRKHCAREPDVLMKQTCVSRLISNGNDVLKADTLALIVGMVISVHLQFLETKIF